MDRTLAAQRTAIKAAQSLIAPMFLTGDEQAQGWKLVVRTWDEEQNDFLTVRPYVGIRVNEVVLRREQNPKRISEASYMQTEWPWGIAVCAQTERIIIAILEKWPPDERNEEIARLGEIVEATKH